MRCLGRKKSSFKRCKNNCKFLFCGFHRWQPVSLILAIITFFVFTTDFFESIGLKKPIEYLTQQKQELLLNSKEVKSSLDKDTSSVKIGIVNMKNIDSSESNILSKLYSANLNDLAELDTLDIYSVDLNVNYNGLLDSGLIANIFEMYNLDVLVWGLVNKTSKANEYCVNYRVNPNTRTMSDGLISERDRTSINFLEGSVNDLLSGELSGDLNHILYTLCLIKLNRDRNDKGTLTLIEKCKTKGITNNSIDFLEAYALLYLGIEMQRCRKLYEGIISNSQGCEAFRLASFSNLAAINYSLKDSIGYLKYAKSGVDLFYECEMDDYSNLIILMYQLGEAFYKNGKIESSLFNYAKGLQLIDSLNLGGHPVHSKMLLESSIIANEIGENQLAYKLSKRALKLIEINDDYLKAHKIDYYMQGVNAARFVYQDEEAHRLIVKCYRTEKKVFLLQPDIMEWLAYMCNNAHILGDQNLVDELNNDIEKIREQKKFNDNEKISYYRIKFIHAEMINDTLNAYKYYKQAFSLASINENADLSVFYNVLIRKSRELGLMSDYLKYKDGLKEYESKNSLKN